MSIVIQCRCLGLSYGLVVALAEVDLELEKGKWLTLIGPNGSGKSSLLKSLTGLVPRAGNLSGEVLFESAPLVKPSRSIAYVPQQPVMPLGITVAEYILLGRSAHLDWYRFESEIDRVRTAEVIAELELQPLAARFVTELSGGEAQRVVLARAIAQDPTLLVMDEPTSALDIAHQMSVLELVDQLRHRKGLTVLSAMHDLGVAARFADELLLLSDGYSVSSGPVGEVLTVDNLSRYFNTRVDVVTAADGAPVVIPLRQSQPERSK